MGDVWSSEMDLKTILIFGSCSGEFLGLNEKKIRECSWKEKDERECPTSPLLTSTTWAFAEFACFETM